MTKMWSAGAEYNVTGQGFDPTKGAIFRSGVVMPPGTNSNRDPGVRSTLLAALLCCDTELFCEEARVERVPIGHAAATVPHPSFAIISPRFHHLLFPNTELTTPSPCIRADQVPDSVRSSLAPFASAGRDVGGEDVAVPRQQLGGAHCGGRAEGAGGAQGG